MSLWWLQPGWGDACCGKCGINIQQDGGDPDWGLCHGCFSGQNAQEPQYSREEYEAYMEAERNAAPSLGGKRGDG